MSRLSALPVLAVAVLFGLVGPLPSLALLIIVVALMPTAFRARIELSRPVEAMVTMLLGVTGLMAPQVLPPTRALLGSGAIHPAWVSLGCTALFMAVGRLFLQRPWAGSAGNLGLLVVSLAVWGGKRSGFAYPVGSAVFLVAAIWAARSNEPARAPLAAFGKRQLAALAISTLTLAGVTGAGAVGLPRLHAWAVKQFILHGPSKTGFTDHLLLGSLRGMLQSDAVVLRVKGAARAGRFRGAVYDRYRGGAWSLMLGARNVGQLPLKPARQEEDLVEVEHVQTPRTYFVPLDSREIAVSTGFATQGPGGTLAVVAGDPARRVWYRPGLRDSPAILAARRQDRVLLRPMVSRLQGLAEKWTAGKVGAAEKLEALQQHLSHEYEYSLEVERPRSVDPVLHFLFVDGRGHCEYFASALALLARSIGIPTRVVGGYTVHERNALGNHYVVRERHAHTWVEAWSDGRWTTWDATPEGPRLATLQSQTPWALAVIDWAGASWTRFLDWLTARSLEEIVGLLVGFVALFLIVRLVRLRRERALREAEGDNSPEDDPLPGFVALSEALAQLGLPRPTNEPLEAFARRLPRDLGELGVAAQRSAEIGQIMGNYAALRYGNIGNVDTVNRAAREAARDLGPGGASDT